MTPPRVSLPKLATVKQVADYYQVHESTVKRWMAAGAVTVTRLGPRRAVRIVLDDDFVVFTTSQTTQST